MVSIGTQRCLDGVARLGHAADDERCQRSTSIISSASRLSVECPESQNWNDLSARFISSAASFRNFSSISRMPGTGHARLLRIAVGKLEHVDVRVQRGRESVQQTSCDLEVLIRKEGTLQGLRADA